MNIIKSGTGLFFHQVGGVSFAHALEKKRNFVENVEKDDGL
jgi:hypothetical protein